MCSCDNWNNVTCDFLNIGIMCIVIVRQLGKYDMWWCENWNNMTGGRVKIGIICHVVM